MKTGYHSRYLRRPKEIKGTAIHAVRNANRVVMCKDYLLHAVEQFVLDAFKEMAAQRRAAWLSPTLVAPFAPSIIPRDFKGDAKLAADMECALEIARRHEMMAGGPSVLLPPSLNPWVHP